MIATSGGNGIVLKTLLLFRSTPTSLGPPGSGGPNSMLPVSSSQSRSSGSTTTLCTDTRHSPGRSLSNLLTSGGNAVALPSFTSATVNSTGSPHRG